jgi:hypothetical protein
MSLIFFIIHSTLFEWRNKIKWKNTRKKILELISNIIDIIHFFSGIKEEKGDDDDATLSETKDEIKIEFSCI